MVGRIKYGKDSLKIWGIREWENWEEIRRVEGMDGGERGGSKNDNWRGFNARIGKEREDEEEGKEGERISKDSKKQRRINVGNGDKGEGMMDDYECRNKERRESGWTYMGEGKSRS